MGKPLAVTAFVLLLLSFPIPVVGNFLSMGAIILASIAAFAGERMWSIVVACVGGIKQFFMSPSWLLAMHTPHMVRGPFGLPTSDGYSLNGLWYLTLVAVIAPLAICGWQAMKDKETARLVASDDGRADQG